MLMIKKKITKDLSGGIPSVPNEVCVFGGGGGGGGLVL